MEKKLDNFEDCYNKGNDCDACLNQYLCGLYGDGVGCRCKDEGLPCDFAEGGE